MLQRRRPLVCGLNLKFHHHQPGKTVCRAFGRYESYISAPKVILMLLPRSLTSSRIARCRHHIHATNEKQKRRGGQYQRPRGNLQGSLGDEHPQGQHGVDGGADDVAHHGAGEKHSASGGVHEGGPLGQEEVHRDGAGERETDDREIDMVVGREKKLRGRADCVCV